jgi:hypothetical protein
MSCRAAGDERVVGRPLAKKRTGPRGKAEEK